MANSETKLQVQLKCSFFYFAALVAPHQVIRTITCTLLHIYENFIVRHDPQLSTMKRRANFNKSLQHCEISVTYVKRERPNFQRRVPATLLASPLTLGKETAESLQVFENNAPFKFLFFLNAHGKEYVDDIAELCFPYLSNIVFVTLDMSSDTANSVVDYVNTDTCKLLAKELGILDPLGGGSYPLNYLVVISFKQVLCMLPIRVGRYYGNHQRFGTCLAETPGILEEYFSYFLLKSKSVVVLDEDLEDIFMKS